MYVYDHSNGIWQRRYSEYHATIVDITCQRLSAAGISYKFSDFWHLEIDLKHEEDLLIIVTQDFMKDPVSVGCLSPMFSQKLYQCAALGKPVLLLTAVHNSTLDFDNVPSNVHFLHYGGDLLFQMNDYPKIQPQRIKNRDMTKFWIAICREPRLHRMMAACWCMGNDLGNGFSPETGNLRISPSKIQEFADWKSYYLSCYQEMPLTTQDQESRLQKGFELVKNNHHGGQPIHDIYPNIDCDNASNFDQSLRFLYRDSVIEIVLETTFFVKGVFVTEKFLNAVYGYNFPIVISTAGTVEYCRQNGFDMFDDVIDHSYDLVQEPMQRIILAIDLNRKLLTDKQYALTAWQSCLPRLDSNFEFAQKKMYDHFACMYTNSLNSYISDVWGLE